MIKKLVLLMTLLLAITLSGWTQSSQNWTVGTDSLKKDTIITYTFTKTDMVHLRTYVTTLEMYKEQYDVNEQVIKKLSEEVLVNKTIIENKDQIIANKDAIIVADNKINDKLTKESARFAKKAKRLPYWLGGGFIGGIILCQLVK